MKQFVDDISTRVAIAKEVADMVTTLNVLLKKARERSVHVDLKLWTHGSEGRYIEAFDNEMQQISVKTSIGVAKS